MYTYGRLAGFDGAQESALDLLGELALRYAGEVGAGARSYAELAGRSSVTFSDVVRAAIGSSSPKECYEQQSGQARNIRSSRAIPSYHFTLRLQRALLQRQSSAL